MTRNLSKAGLVLLTLAIAASNSADAGWLKKTTGIRTPEPIRKIAPNGISMPRPQNNTSEQTWSGESTTVTSINNSGDVYEREVYGSGRTTNWRYVGRAAVIFRGNEAYWSYKGTVQRAPQHDRRTTSYAPPTPMPNYPTNANQFNGAQQGYNAHPQQLTPEQQLIIGIIQAIQQAEQNNR